MQLLGLVHSSTYKTSNWTLHFTPTPINHGPTELGNQTRKCEVYMSGDMKGGRAYRVDRTRDLKKSHTPHIINKKYINGRRHNHHITPRSSMQRLGRGLHTHQRTHTCTHTLQKKNCCFKFVLVIMNLR